MSGPVDPLAPFGRVTGRASLTVLRQGGEESASFDELLERGRRGATRLAARGVGPGDSVAILGEPSVAFHVGVLSAWAAGAACLPLPPPAPLELPASWAERTGRVLATAGARVVVAPSGGAPADVPVPVVAAEDLDEGPGATPATPDDGDPGLILLTSGSSSEPKGVVISFRAVAARAESQLLEGLDDDRDRFLTWLPPAWSGGFNAQLLRPLASGVSSVVLPTGAVLEHPLRWLAEIGRWRATMSGCGTYGYGLVAGRLGHEPAPDVDLSCWTHVWSAGERIDPDTIGRFLALAAPLGLDPRSFQPRYSLSECSTVASRPAGAGLAVDAVDAGGLADGDARPSTGADAARFVSNGPPLRGVELWIEGPDGASLPERGVGEVRVRCPMMLDAYLGDPERTAQALAGGWLRTGDLGYVAD
ncbi:MAG TPA: AMP-binding protein, partial [Actinomycetota bacterium]|nr:AMP-binding protein [Actinomycetota bacterium]